MKKEIVNYLLGCGIRPNLKGFRFLYRAIEITIENNNILQICSEIYQTIAEEFNESASKVERAIRHSIKTSKENNMTNSEFIATAALEISFK